MGVVFITPEEFCGFLKHPLVDSYCRLIDLDVQQAWSLWPLLDIDQTGRITCDEFVKCSLRLRGPAKAIDMATLLQQNSAMYQRVRTIEAKIETLSGTLPKHSWRYTQCQTPLLEEESAGAPHIGPVKAVVQPAAAHRANSLALKRGNIVLSS